MVTNNLVRSRIIVSGVDETLPLYLGVDAWHRVGVYVESWSKTKYGDIVQMVSLRANEDDGGRIRTADSPITSLAVDWVTLKVYMSLETESANSGRIEVCHMTVDSRCAVLLYRDLDAIISLAVDPTDGYGDIFIEYTIILQIHVLAKSCTSSYRTRMVEW
jgi:hypothetical protein